MRPSWRIIERPSKYSRSRTILPSCASMTLHTTTSTALPVAGCPRAPGLMGAAGGELQNGHVRASGKVVADLELEIREGPEVGLGDGHSGAFGDKELGVSDLTG